MKKMILFCLFCIIGCTCNNEELSKNLIDPINKEYLKANSEIVLFKNQNDTDILVQFESSSFVTSKEDVGPESCEYNTYECGKKIFTMGNYSGQILIDYNSSLSIQINDNADYNTLVLENPQEEHFDNLLNDIELSGFTFNNVLLLDKKIYKNGSINKILYSKPNGIEFILFEDGTWYKRVE